MGRRLRVLAVMMLAGTSAVSCVTPPAPCGGFVPKQLPEFVFGASSTDISERAIDVAAATGSRWVRIPIRWSYVEPTVSELPRLTRAELAARPELVEQFADRVDWSLPDRVLAHATSRGLQVMGFVGLNQIPSLDGVALNPATLGVESYLAHQELVTRAFVRRYGPQRVGAPQGVSTIRVWVLEGELNIAPAQTLFGWRQPSGPEAFLTSPWASFEFQTDLLRSVGRGVRAEDPDAVTTTLINTDMADAFNTLFGRPGWEGAVSQWRTLVDVIGLDTYPNYFLSQPVDGTVVGARVRRLRELVCPGQQVMVTETGYPNGPVDRGYSPEAQAEYLSEAWDSARAAGVAGFMPFGGEQPEAADTPLSPQDRANLDRVGAALRTGDVGALLGLLVTQGDWLLNRLPEQAQAVEGHWGFVRPDGSPLPAFEVVRRIAAESAGT